MTTQAKQGEWAWQWEQVFDENTWLFQEWIWPNRLEDFRDQDVLDCGCGAGQHLHQVAPFCRTVTGIDLNAAEIARRNTAQHANVTVIEGDIATIDLRRTFDVVYSVGMLHHTDDPARTFRNIARHCRPHGRVIVWVYSREGTSGTAPSWNACDGSACVGSRDARCGGCRTCSQPACRFWCTQSICCR